MDLLSYFINNLDKEEYRKRFRGLAKALDKYQPNTGGKIRKNRVLPIGILPDDTIMIIGEFLPLKDLFDFIDGLSQDNYTKSLFLDNYGNFWNRKLRLEFLVDPQKKYIGIPKYFLNRNTQKSYESAKEFFFFLEDMKVDLIYYGNVENVVNDRGNELLYQETTKILHNHDIVETALNHNGMGLQYLPDSFKDSVFFVFIAVVQNSLALQYASNRRRNYFDIVYEAIKKNGLAVMYASDRLKNNNDIVDEAVRQNGLALQYATNILKYDVDIVTEAVKQNGIALQYANIRLKDNRYVVTEAVKQNGIALQYATNRLKNDRLIVKDAVRQNGLSLQYASNRLKDNNDIANHAIKQNPKALFYTSPRFYQKKIKKRFTQMFQ